MNFKNSAKDGFRRTAAPLLLVLAAVACGLAVQAAQARPTIPISATAPGVADPQHNTPLELLASSVASGIAGYPVSVRCDSLAVWSGYQVKNGETAFTGWSVNSVSHVFTANASGIEIAPSVCRALQTFAQATVKPTQCAVKGGPAVPCFDGTYTARNIRHDYWRYVKALQTLAHESIHARQGRAGAAVPSDTLVESQAECVGMQDTARVAEAFGDSAADAQSLADYYWRYIYPDARKLSDPYALQYPYWSAQCKPGGTLDERPAGSTVWP